MKQAETLVAQVPQAELMDEQQLNREVTDIEFQAEAMVIQNDEDYAAAGEFGKLLKQKAAQVTSFFKPMKDSAYQAHKAVCDREKAMLTPLKNAESVVKKAMSNYFMEQERRRKEAEEAARRAAEAERERKLQEAAELESAGDKDGAELYRGGPHEAEGVRGEHREGLGNHRHRPEDGSHGPGGCGAAPGGYRRRHAADSRVQGNHRDSRRHLQAGGEDELQEVKVWATMR